MNKKISSLFFIVVALFSNFVVNAQQGDSTSRKEPEMADVMRSNGKIYVVLAVALIILTGLIIYVARLDRKISKLEKKV